MQNIAKILSTGAFQKCTVLLGSSDECVSERRESNFEELSQTTEQTVLKMQRGDLEKMKVEVWFEEIMYVWNCFTGRWRANKEKPMAEMSLIVSESDMVR